MDKPIVMTVRAVEAPPVQPSQNEPEVKGTILSVAIPPVQPSENEPERDLAIPLMELKESPLAEDEKDTVLRVPAATMPPVQPTQDDPLKKMIVPLSGKLITAEDPLIIGTNFRTLINMRYGDKSPVSIPGMTKINSSVMDSTYLKTRNAHHFRKIQPAETQPVESHVLVQAYNTDLTAARILESATDIPDTGRFVELMTLDVAPAAPGWKAGDTITGQSSAKTCVIVRKLTTLTYHVKDRDGDYTLNEILTNGTTTADQGAANPTFALASLWSDSSGFGTGRFDQAPNGHVAYCNGVDTCLWGGDGIPVARFLNFDSAQSFLYDHTELLSNSKESDTITLIADAADGGLDGNTVLLLSLDNNVTDQSANAHTVNNDAPHAITFSNTAGEFKWGYSGVFDGAADYLIVPDHADFDLSDGTWSLDGWFKVTSFAAAHPIYYQKTDVTKISFSGGEHEPTVGEAIHGATSAATGIVDYVDVTAGDWGGTAAGTIYMHTVTGTWEAEVIHGGDDTTIGNCTGAASDAGDNYICISFNTSSQISIVVHECYGAGSDVVSATSYYSGTTTAWHHVEITENGNSWYVLVDGQLIHTFTDAQRARNYVGSVWIGYDGTNYYSGKIDELRVSKAVRHTARFDVPTSAYTNATGIAKCYLMTPRPAQGFKFYVPTANTSAAVASGGVWDGDSFSVLTLYDGTIATAGKTLSQTGSISFASTVGTAAMKYLDGSLGYCYELSFSGIDAATAIYHVTADCPFQANVDIWDGIWRYISKFYLYKTTYEDYSVNVFEDRYDSTDPTTFVELDALTSSQFAEIGFTERMTAIGFALPSGSVNTTANTVATLYYWTGSAYTSVGTITDGTAVGAIALSVPGVVSWEAPSETAEQKKVINNGLPQYFYKVVWNQTLSADVQLSYVYGIPAQKTIRGYKFPLFGQERLLLCNNTDEERNSVLYPAPQSAQVFNGSESGKLYFGDNTDLTCGCNVFAQFAQSLYNITLFFKETEMWSLVKNVDGTFHEPFCVSNTIGCNAPITLKTVVIPPISEDKSGNRNLAVWMNSSGVYVSDGRHPILVSHDIRDLFDQNSATHINLSYIQNASSQVDQDKLECHFYFAVTTGAVTANDVEWVLDMRRWRWYEVERGTALQCGINVSDEYGNNFTYGFIDTGYMERLEYGTTFDSTAIVSMFQLGDFPLTEGDFLTETRARKFIQVMATKATTTANVKLTHYIDTQEEILTLDVAAGTAWVVGDTITGQTSGTKCVIVKIYSTLIFSIKNRTGDFTLNEILTNGTYTADQGAAHPTITGPTDYSCDPTLAYYRLTFPVKDANSVPGVLHSIREVIVTNDESCGFGPLVMGIYYEVVREHLS